MCLLVGFSLAPIPPEHTLCVACYIALLLPRLSLVCIKFNVIKMPPNCETTAPFPSTSTSFAYRLMTMQPMLVVLE